MEKSANTVIGYLTDVQGNLLNATLIEDEQGQIPVITVGDEDITVGKLGSYVVVRQIDIQIVAMVTRMTEQEALASSVIDTPGEPATRLPYAKRNIQLTPIGSINAEGHFDRGVGQYPTTGAEVHVISSNRIDIIFGEYKSRGFEVGVLSTQPTIRMSLSASNLFGRHLAILGQTGAGKSWTVATLVQKAVATMPKAHIVILDIHGEYCWKGDTNTRQYAFKETNVRHVDARELEIPYWLMTYAELCDMLVDRTEQAAHNQTAFFKDTLRELREKEKEALGLERVTVDTPVFFSLDELLDIIREKNSEMVPGQRGPKKGDLNGQFDRLLMRIESRMNDVRYDFLLKPRVRTNSASLVGLLRDFVGLGDTKVPITIIDLSSVPFDVRPTVAAQVGRLAFEFNYWNPQYRDFPILLMCEEAHVYIPRASENQFAGSRKSMERIAKEGRKYGVGLAIVSQRPHEISETVLAQCGSFICLRITNPEDQSYIRKLVPESEGNLVSILAGLGRGEALVLGEAVPLPTRLLFDRPEPHPNSDDVDFYQMWKNGPDDLDVEAIVDRWRKQER